MAAAGVRVAVGQVSGILDDLAAAAGDRPARRRRRRHRRLQHDARQDDRGLLRQHAAAAGHGLGDRGRAGHLGARRRGDRHRERARGVELGIEADGIVQEIQFRANDRVKVGQRLLQIDDRIERADLAAAEAQLDLSQERSNGSQALRDRGVAPVSDLDVARADATNARAQVVKLTAVLEQKALEAPFDGIVGIPQVEIGAYVTPGTVYATLQDSTPCASTSRSPSSRSG